MCWIRWLAHSVALASGVSALVLVDRLVAASNAYGSFVGWPPASNADVCSSGGHRQSCSQSGGASIVPGGPSKESSSRAARGAGPHAQVFAEGRQRRLDGRAGTGGTAQNDRARTAQARATSSRVGGLRSGGAQRDDLWAATAALTRNSATTTCPLCAAYDRVTIVREWERRCMSLTAAPVRGVRAQRTAAYHSCAAVCMCSVCLS